MNANAVIAVYLIDFMIFSLCEDVGETSCLTDVKLGSLWWGLPRGDQGSQVRGFPPRSLGGLGYWYFSSSPLIRNLT